MTDRSHSSVDPELHPQVRSVMDRNNIAGIPGSDAISVDTARELFRESMTSQSVADVHDIKNISIPGPESEIPLRIYIPEEEPPYPIMVFFHGGGWIMGDLDCYDQLCTRLAQQTGSLVISCEYRLAPENPFPAAPKDCYAATEWVCRNADALNGNSTQVTVAGTSAGGNLAAVVALMARDRGGPEISHQLLLYPVLNSLLINEYDSYRKYSTGYVLSTPSMRRFVDEYISDPIDARNGYAFPLVADDLSGLPPLIIVSAQFDPLRDEAFRYADRLESSGVPVTHKHYKRMSHDFLSMVDTVDNATEGIEDISQELARMRG